MPFPLQTYPVAVGAVAVKVAAAAPEQISALLTETEGKLWTVTLMVSLPTQPLPLVTVT